MTIEQDFLVWAGAGGANVISEAAFSGLGSELSNGFSSGIAPSNICNKIWRQSSIMAAVLGDLIVAQTSQPVIDDGTTTTILANLTAAIKTLAGTQGIGSAVQSYTGNLYSGSRNFGVTYTNTTALPIGVSIFSTASGAWSTVGYSEGKECCAAGGNGTGAQMFMIVAPGATYSATESGIGSSQWVELR